MAILEVRNIEKHFGRTNVLKEPPACWRSCAVRWPPTRTATGSSAGISNGSPTARQSKNTHDRTNNKEMYNKFQKF